MGLNDKLKNLTEIDTYSLILFALYRLTNQPEYSSISELVYVLDKENFLNLCEFFGGTTIYIPTIDELEILVDGLDAYQKINIDKMPFEEYFDSVVYDGCKLKQIKDSYKHLCEVLDEFSFER